MMGMRRAQHWDLRAADSDREQAVEQLREHCAAGRLSLEEFEARLDETWQARTYRELALVTRELPRLERRPRWAGLPVGRHVLANAVVLAVWLLAGDAFPVLEAAPVPLATALASLGILSAQDRLRARRARALGARRTRWQVAASDRWRLGATPPGERGEELRRMLGQGGWAPGPAGPRQHQGRWVRQGTLRPREGPWL